MRSVNAALGLLSYSIAIISNMENLEEKLKKDFNLQYAYYQDMSKINNGR